MPRIVVHLPDLSESEATQVVSDAIYEYRARRESAHDYVHWRYAGHTNEFKARKFASVVRRLDSVNDCFIDALEEGE